MSWSANYVSKPEDVARALAIHSESNEQSQREFEACKGHIIGLVNQNFGLSDTCNVYVMASGGGTERSVEGGNVQPVSHNVSLQIGTTYVDSHQYCKFVPPDEPPAGTELAQ